MKSRTLTAGAVATAVLVVAVVSLVAYVALWWSPDRPESDRDYSAALDAMAAHNSAAAKAATSLVVERPSGRPLRVLYLGDSLTDGFQASDPSKRYAQLVTDGLAEDGPVAATIRGYPGQTTSQVLAKVPAGKFDLLVVELGTNDQSKSTLARYAKDYPGVLSELRQSSPDAALLCLEPWLGADVVQPYSDVVDGSCAAESGTTVDLPSLYTDASLRSPQPGVPNADDFHPNNRGHAAIAKAVLATPIG